MFKKLKSIFIVDDEDFIANQKGEKIPANVDPKSDAKSDAKTTDAYVPTVDASKFKSTAESSRKFVDVLLKAIEANNLEGFDYLEYKQSLQNLSKMAMDEETRYKSAFAMAQTMGVTSAKLVTAAQHYITILSEEDSKFKAALKNQKNKQINERQQKIKDFELMITNKSKQIESLKKDLEKHKKQLEKEKQSVQGAAEKVEKTRINFESAYDSVAGQIRDDIQKMKKYLK